MKKVIYIVCLFTLLKSQGQTSTSIFGKNALVNLENFDKQRVYFGFFLGFNAYEFKLDYKNENPNKEIVVNNTTGFNVGLVADLRLHEYINLRFEPGLYYTQRDLVYKGFTKELDYLREVKSTYIHLPLLLKFSSKRVGNIRPFLLGGVSATLNLASNNEATDDNLQQRFRVQRWTQNYEIGFGMDFYLEYFKFSPSIRGVFGINDELIRDKDPLSPWTSNIDALRTRAVLINFTFH